AGDKDAGKTTVEVTIPKDGSVKPGDKVVVTDDNGKKTEKPINQDDIDKGKIDIPVDLNPGKDNNVTAEIINPNNPNNPGKDSKVIGEASSTVKVTIDEIIDDVTGGVVNGDVKNGLTNDNLPTFKGSAAPGATVEIYESFYTTTEKTLVGKTVADANGKWSFTPTEAMGDGEHYFEAVATDKVGNKSTSDRVSLDVDTFADAPVIDAVNDNVDSQTGNVLDAKTKVALTNDSTPTLEGYAEPDSVITIYEISELNGEKTAIGTVTADNHGGWKFELPELGDGEYKYTTRAQDKAGNISDFSEEVVVNADLIAPSEPTITFVEDVNPKDGKLNKAENSKDGDSASTKAQISVPGDAEENDVIHYTVNGEEKTHTITYNDRVTGYVEIKVPVVDGKASSVTAKIVDQAGNASKEVSSSIDVDIHIDAPVITAVTDNWWGGVENDGNVLGANDGFTNDTTPTFKGKAEAGSTIVLKNGNDIIAEKVIVDSDGNWEFTPKSPLAEGEYNVVAIATDKAGNVSVPSNVATVNVDISTTQPVITEIIDDEAGGVVGNVKNALTNDNLPTLKGTAEAFSTVKIMVDDRMVFKDGKEVTVTADKDGNWEYTFEANLNWGGKVHAALEDGVHTLKVQTTDRAGNRSAVSEWSSVDVDKTIGIPKVKITTDTNGDKNIDIDDASALKDGKLKWVIEIPENTVKAGDRVQILGSDAKTWTDIFKVTAQDIAKGFIERDEFSIDMPKSRGFQTPSYRLVDDAGNVSEGSMDAVKIVGFAPKAPTIIAVLDNEYGIDPKDPISINAGDTTGNVLEGVIAITNDNTPTLMGKAEAGTTITLKKGNTVIADNIPVDANGSWHYEPEENSPWADGDYKITAIAKNIFGKESESSSPITVTVDTTGPEVTLTSIEDSVKTNDVVDFTGNVKDKVTNDNTPLLKGTAEAGSVIIIKYGEHHENEVTTKADKNGHWEYKITNPLSDGEHIISYQAVDKAGNTSLEYVANVTVDTKIADAKVEFIEDTNNDGKFSWKENIENTHTGRLSWKALIPDDGSIKAGDIFHYKWDETGWHERAISQAEIDRGYIGEMKNNQIGKDQPDAGKPMPYGKNANGSVYVAEAFFSDAAGNKGAKGSDKVVFDFSDNTDNKHIATTNVKITSIYDDVRGGHLGNLITNEAAQVAGLTNDKTPTISGTAEANASVKVSVVDGKLHSVWEKTITAESDGSWKVTTDDIADGNYSVTAVATNKAGAVSNPYVVSNLEIDTTIAQPNIWIKEDANQDKIYDKADYENPANGNGDITFVVDIPQDRVTIKAGDVFHYMINTNNPKWGNINGYTEDITITEADIKSGSISRVVTLCDDGKDFNMSHNGMIVSMNGQFKDLAGNALSNDTMVRFDLKNTYGGKVRSTRSLPDDILDNDSVDLSNAARINEPKAELNVLNNNKIGVSANDLLETPKDHIMNEGKSEAKPSYATASSHAGEENIATTHPIQIEEKVENYF
ncbi:Ig-like domain-containing protein, partial [Campylobacter concisus]|uniref:Ig-like domain-containing protein n=2 Tax=Campylobacter concisus TaxID=199 RepID=UPI00165F3EE4